MRTHETQTSPHHQPTAIKPFFGARSDQAFFSTERAAITPFFQPPAATNSPIHAQAATAERADLGESAVPQPSHTAQQLSTVPIQAKLTIGPVGDRYEQEADRVAAQVVQQISTPAATQAPPGQLVQRMEEKPEELQAKPEITTLQRMEEKPEELQAKPEITPLQRMEEKPEELQAKPEITTLQRMEEKPEELQAKSILQHQGKTGGEAAPDLTTAIDAARGSGQPLDASLQRSMGRSMGADFSGVKVHTDSQADQLNRSIQAQAFTTGQDVFFRQGAYEPGSLGGQELIAHELTHVVQQNGAAVQRSSHRQKTPIPIGNNLIQLMSFNRFSGFLGGLNFTSYNAEERKLLDLEKRAGETLDGLKGYQADEQYGEAVNNLNIEFTQLTNGTYAESEYEATLKSLNTLYYAANSLSTKIAAQDFQDEKELNKLIAGSFVVVEPTTQATQPNQVTQATLLEITAILNDIYFAHESNLVIAPDMSYNTYDLAKRSAELDQPVPPEVVILESKIRKMEDQRGLLQVQLDNELDTRFTLEKSIETKRQVISNLDPETKAVQIKDLTEEIKQEQLKLESTKTNISQIKQNQEELDKKTAVPQKEYNILVKRIIKKETMKDLVKIAQTNVGRDLLKAIAKTSLESNAKKVTINAYSQYKNPTAAESKGSKNPYVDYTPQYFKNRDNQERQVGGAIRKFEALKAHNPWQENERTDITLFHELVHTYHFQSGASEKNDLVSAENAVHEVDRPYVVGEDQRGVREEEYATVGLGQYSKDKYTENAYRAERRLMGEDVSLRDMYTHKDGEGNRAI
jgi:Domain of unknown function (DUF4157)/Effector protein